MKTHCDNGDWLLEVELRFLKRVGKERCKGFGMVRSFLDERLALQFAGLESPYSTQPQAMA